jgi:hypothetical protein
MITEERHIQVHAPPEAAFAFLQQLGGNTGWLFADTLWRLRGLIDQLLGGPGYRQGRRHPTQLRPGDPVDFWRVEALDHNRWLRLRAEMRLPGTVRMTFEVEALSDAVTEVTQRLEFAPAGRWGRLYWIVVAPLHRWVFSGMMRGIQQGIEETVS